MIKFSIPVQPMGAVRMTGRGKFIKSSAQRYLNYKNKIQFYAIAQAMGQLKFSGPVEVNVLFKMPIPSSWSKKKSAAAIGEYHIKKPDTDNLVKGVFDSLNKIVWHDDNQVAKVTAVKVYGENPGIEITVSQLK